MRARICYIVLFAGIAVLAWFSFRQKQGLQAAVMHLNEAHKNLQTVHDSLQKSQAQIRILLDHLKKDEQNSALINAGVKKLDLKHKLTTHSGQQHIDSIFQSLEKNEKYIDSILKTIVPAHP